MYYRRKIQQKFLQVSMKILTFFSNNVMYNSCFSNRCESFIDGLERKFGRRFQNDIGMRMMDNGEDSELKKKPFNAMDTNGDTFLTFTEMRDILTPIGVTIMEIGKIIAQADTNQDQRVDYQEFELLRSVW